MLDQHEGGPGGVPDGAQHRPERFGLGPGQTGRRLVEEQHAGLLGQQAGELDKAARPRRELGGEPVAEHLEPEHVEDALHPLGHLRLGEEGGGEAQSGGQRFPGGDPALAGDGHRLGHGQAGEQAGVL